jgi:hypothetical protein
MAGPTGMSWTLPSGGGLELGRQFSGQSAADASLRCPALCPLADFSAVHRARRCPASAPGWPPGTAPAPSCRTRMPRQRIPERQGIPGIQVDLVLSALRPARTVPSASLPRLDHKGAGRHAPPGAPARCLAAGSGAACVRRWCAHRSQPCPRRDPGGMRHGPGHWRVEGRDPLVARLPHARAGGRHMVRVAVTCAVTAMAGSGRRPGTCGPLRGTGRGPVPIRREWARPGLGQSGAVSCLMVPLPVGPVRCSIPSVTKCPGSDGPPRSCQHGLAGVARRAASFPLRAAVSPHRPPEPGQDFFESWRSSWSSVTESNRRSSPYHGYPAMR